MLNIKEIALKIADSLRNKVDGISHMQSNQGLVRFAEALISAYKAELLKEVGEPVYFEWRHCDASNDPKGIWSEWKKVEPRNAYVNTVEDSVAEFDAYIAQGYKYELRKLYTSDQLAAAILKATKPLEGKIERLKRQSANRLIGLCKGGEDNDELRSQLAAAQEQQQTTFLQLSHALRITEEKLAKAEQLWQVAQGRCDGLEEKLVKAEQRVAEWQPIETAPKDGQSYLAYSTEFVNQYWVTDKCNGMTHWMPLPTPPKRSMEGV